MGMKAYRRSKGNVHPGAAAAHTPVDPEAVRDVRLRTVDTVCQVIPGCPDCDTGGHTGPDPDGYCDRRTVLAALFQPTFRTPADNKPRTRERVLRLNGVDVGTDLAGGAS